MVGEQDYVIAPFGVSYTGPVVPPPVPPQGEYLPSPTIRRAPEAKFTPTAAGLRVGEGHVAGPALDFQSMVSEAISRIFAAGIQQASRLTPTAIAVPPQVQAASPGTSGLAPVQEYVHSEGSLQDEEYLGDLDLSEDEGMEPDMPAFPGLFKPSLLKSLLHKAKVATNMGLGSAPASQAQDASGPSEHFFRVPKQEPEFVPCPGSGLGHSDRNVRFLF